MHKIQIIPYIEVPSPDPSGRILRCTRSGNGESKSIREKSARRFVLEYACVAD